MHLRSKESIHRVYRRHYFPFILETLKVLGASAPFYFVLFVLQQTLTSNQFMAGFFFITVLFVIVYVVVAFLYWADKLVVTNFRVIFVDWKLLNMSEEHEAELHDIQDIHIVEKGLLSFIPFLDYGSLTIATAASEVSVRFDYAPDPDEIKRFIFSEK